VTKEYSYNTSSKAEWGEQRERNRTTTGTLGGKSQNIESAAGKRGEVVPITAPQEGNLFSISTQKINRTDTSLTFSGQVKKKVAKRR